MTVPRYVYVLCNIFVKKTKLGKRWSEILFELLEIYTSVLPSLALARSSTVWYAGPAAKVKVS
jgi:hypothetical protein